MGTPLDRDCPDSAFTDFCWTAGNRFEPGPTPECMPVQIEGVRKGDLWVSSDGEPLNGIWMVPRNSDSFFLLITDFLSIGFIFPAGLTILDVKQGPGATIQMFLRNTTQCAKVFSNSLNFPAGNHFFSGRVTILKV